MEKTLEQQVTELKAEMFDLKKELSDLQERVDEDVSPYSMDYIKRNWFDERKEFYEAMLRIMGMWEWMWGDLKKQIEGRLEYSKKYLAEAGPAAADDKAAETGSLMDLDLDLDDLEERPETGKHLPS